MKFAIVLLLGSMFLTQDHQVEAIRLTADPEKPALPPKEKPK